MHEESSSAGIDNRVLTDSCVEKQVACCKDGYIFLPRNEYEAILRHLEGKSDEMKDFLSRITDHGDFLLYNQRTRCQFLQSDNRCGLYDSGVRPTECFWWPAHVYLAEDGKLEIRIARCCSACSLLKPDSVHVADVARQARAIGLDLIKKFREIHSYGKDYRVVARL